MGLKEVELERFKAQGSDGHIYTVVKYRNVLSGAGHGAVDALTFRTARGELLHRIDDDTFDLAPAMLTLKRRTLGRGSRLPICLPDELPKNLPAIYTPG